MKCYILLAFLLMGAVSACNPGNHQSTKVQHHIEFTEMTLTELLGEKTNLHIPNNVMRSIMLELQDPENKYSFDTDTYIEHICTLEYKEYIIYFYPTHQGYTKINNGEYEYIKYFQSPSFNKFINENKLREELWRYCAFHNHDKQIRNYLKQSLLRFFLKKE